MAMRDDQSVLFPYFIGYIPGPGSVVLRCSLPSSQLHLVSSFP
jgi:hypothetical protein